MRKTTWGLLSTAGTAGGPGGGCGGCGGAGGSPVPFRTPPAIFGSWNRSSGGAALMWHDPSVTAQPYDHATQSVHAAQALQQPSGLEAFVTLRPVGWTWMRTPRSMPAAAQPAASCDEDAVPGAGRWLVSAALAPTVLGRARQIRSSAGRSVGMPRICSAGVKSRAGARDGRRRRRSARPMAALEKRQKQCDLKDDGKKERPREPGPAAAAVGRVLTGCADRVLTGC